MVSVLGEICAIGWGTFGGLVCCIGCCEKITNQNNSNVSIKPDNYSTLSNKIKEDDSKIISIQHYPLNNSL